jgi:hypothetical protein
MAASPNVRVLGPYLLDYGSDFGSAEQLRGDEVHQ